MCFLSSLQTNSSKISISNLHPNVTHDDIYVSKFSIFISVSVLCCILCTEFRSFESNGIHCLRKEFLFLFICEPPLGTLSEKLLEFLLANILMIVIV